MLLDVLLKKDATRLLFDNILWRWWKQNRGLSCTTVKSFNSGRLNNSCWWLFHCWNLFVQTNGFDIMSYGCTECKLVFQFICPYRVVVLAHPCSSLVTDFTVHLPNTGWRTKCRTIDCAYNTFLLLQKHLTSGTELILIGWKIVPNEEHVQCDHCFASQPLANEPSHLSQLFDTSLQKVHGTTLLCGPWAVLHFLWRPENVAQLKAHIVKLCRALSEDLCRKVMTNARVRLQEVVRQNSGRIEHVLH